MAIKPHAGFLEEDMSLYGAVILTICDKRATSGKADPITLSEIQDETNLSVPQIREEVKKLVDLGCFAIESGDLENLGSFQVTGIPRYPIRIDQKTLPLDKPVPPDTSSPSKRREENGKDVVTIGASIYYGHVQYQGEGNDPAYELSIKWGPAGTVLEEAEDLFTDASSTTMAAAWLLFDNYISKNSRFDERQMFNEDSDGVVWWFETMDEKGAEEGSVTGRIGLQISKALKKEDGTTLKESDFTIFSDGIVFDTEDEAWTYVDEFLEAPKPDLVDEQLNPEPWGEKSPDLAGEFELEGVGEVRYQYWKELLEGNDYMLFQADGKALTLSVSHANWPPKKPMEKAIIDFAKDLDWSDPVEPEVSLP